MCSTSLIATHRHKHWYTHRRKLLASLSLVQFLATRYLFGSPNVVDVCQLRSIRWPKQAWTYLENKSKWKRKCRTKSCNKRRKQQQQKESTHTHTAGKHTYSQTYWKHTHTRTHSQTVHKRRVKIWIFLFESKFGSLSLTPFPMFFEALLETQSVWWNANNPKGKMLQANRKGNTPNAIGDSFTLESQFALETKRAFPWHCHLVMHTHTHPWVVVVYLVSGCSRLSSCSISSPRNLFRRRKIITRPSLYFDQHSRNAPQTNDDTHTHLVT